MLCLVARSADDVRRFELPRETATIGKANENDIVLPFAGVSRRHALLTRTPVGLLLTDAGSKNGLVLDGLRVASTVLAPGNRIQVGSAILGIEEADTDDVHRTTSAPGKFEGPRFMVDTETLFGQATETDAIAFIGEIERKGDRAARSDMQSLTIAARRLLHASSVSIIDATRDDVAFRALAGPMPDDSLIGEIVRLAIASKGLDDDIRRIGAHSVVTTARMRSGRVAMLLAVFDGPPRALASWEKWLIVFLASKLIHVRRDDDVEPVAAVLPPNNIIGDSEAMRRTVATALSYARATRPVLIQGETGTGKELLAQLIHENSAHAHGPFIRENCAALAKDILEAELFGVESGVATNVTARPGLFVAADGGTLFLDEIGELSHATQAALLRVIERQEVRPLGARTPRKISVRVVFATHRDVGPEGNVPTIRPDLFFRCFPLQLPALRERREDVPALAMHFLDRFCRKMQRPMVSLTTKAMRLLCDHEWPGNVRELEYAIEEAILRFGNGGSLQSEHVQAILKRASVPARSGATDLLDERDARERKRVEDALRECRGNKTKAAKALGLSRNGLRNMMVRLGITTAH